MRFHKLAYYLNHRMFLKYWFDQILIVSWIEFFDLHFKRSKDYKGWFPTPFPVWTIFLSVKSLQELSTDDKIHNGMRVFLLVESQALRFLDWLRGLETCWLWANELICMHQKEPEIVGFVARHRTSRSESRVDGSCPGKTVLHIIRPAPWPPGRCLAPPGGRPACATGSGRGGRARPCPSCDRRPAAGMPAASTLT